MTPSSRTPRLAGFVWEVSLRSVTIGLVAPMPYLAIAVNLLAMMFGWLSRSLSMLPLVANNLTLPRLLVSAFNAPASPNVMSLPVVRIRPVLSASVIASLTVIAPLVRLPITIVAAVMPDSSAAESANESSAVFPRSMGRSADDVKI